MKLSLVIATYNRTKFVIEAIEKVLINPAINEIIIVDDHSEVSVYLELFNLLNELDSEKIKLFRNKENLGPMLNKYGAVKKCNNDWVIMLDSDNIIDNDYIDKILALVKEKDMLYCPETLKEINGKINFTYKEFCNLEVDRDVVKKHIDKANFEAWMNTGNYFFNKRTYLSIIEANKLDDELIVTDSVYFSYLWLLCGNRMKIVPDMYYIHRIHKGSWWQNHSKACIKSTAKIVSLIKQM
jgi:glycosyltransferase involved in cell wall biosynthesis